MVSRNNLHRQIQGKYLHCTTKQTNKNHKLPCFLYSPYENRLFPGGIAIKCTKFQSSFKTQLQDMAGISEQSKSWLYTGQHSKLIY